MFPACSQHVPQAERKYGPIADFDVSGITDMKGLFQDTSSVTTMKYMYMCMCMCMHM